MTVAKSRSRHGFHRLKVAIKQRDLRALDKRTAGGKALMQWQSELLRDLGGEDHLSIQKRALVDTVVRTKLYIDSLDAWLLGQRSLVNGRKKQILPALRERMALVESLSRILGQLGLERLETAALPSLAEYIERVKPHIEEPEEEQNV
jgi:hypothetical protein